MSPRRSQETTTPQDVSTTLNVLEGKADQKLEQKGGGMVAIGEMDRIAMISANFIEPCKVAGSKHIWTEKDVSAML